MLSPRRERGGRGLTINPLGPGGNIPGMAAGEREAGGDAEAGGLEMPGLGVRRGPVSTQPMSRRNSSPGRRTSTVRKWFSEVASSFRNSGEAKFTMPQGHALLTGHTVRCHAHTYTHTWMTCVCMRGRDRVRRRREACLACAPGSCGCVRFCV